MEIAFSIGARTRRDVRSGGHGHNDHEVVVTTAVPSGEIPEAGFDLAPDGTDDPVVAGVIESPGGHHVFDGLAVLQVDHRVANRSSHSGIPGRIGQDEVGPLGEQPLVVDRPRASSSPGSPGRHGGSARAEEWRP